MNRKFALVTVGALLLVSAPCKAVFAGSGSLKNQVSQFTAMTQVAYIACHAEIGKNFAQAQFENRDMTTAETTQCSSKAEDENKSEFGTLRRKLGASKDALAALKDYYSEWLAAIEGGVESDALFYENLGRLRKKAAALELEVE